MALATISSTRFTIFSNLAVVITALWTTVIFDATTRNTIPTSAQTGAIVLGAANLSVTATLSWDTNTVSTDSGLPTIFVVATDGDRTEVGAIASRA